MAAKTKAFAYLRVSGQGQVKGHGHTRQRQVVQAWANRNHVEIVGEFREAYTGTETDRPAFTDMLAAMLANGVRTIACESLDRFARDVAIQVALLARLVQHGITLVSASTGQDVTEAIRRDPMAEAMVLMQGVFAQTEKKLLVRKLAKARQAKREATGRCEGRKPYGDRPGEPEAVERILALRRKRPGGRATSYAAIAQALNADGVPTRYGSPWAPATVQNVVKRSRRHR